MWILSIKIKFSVLQFVTDRECLWATFVPLVTRPHTNAVGNIAWSSSEHFQSPS